MTQPVVRGSRRGIGRIVTALVIALVVAAVVAGTVGYRNVRRPQGSEPTGQSPIPACALDDSLLQQTQTHNYEHGHIYGLAIGDPTSADLNAECLWKQTKGTDGVDARSVKLYLARFDGSDGVTRAEYSYQHETPVYTISAPQVSDAAGIGDEASFTIAANSTTTQVGLLTRQGNRLVGVGIEGTDHKFFWHTPMSSDEGKRLTELIARELLRRNW